LTIVPSTAARLTKVAHASDGGIAAVVLTPLQARFQVVVSHRAGGRFTVNVDLQGFKPSPSPASS
jgi:hypothetical protein